jgi:hypothetical protein
VLELKQNVTIPMLKDRIEPLAKSSMEKGIQLPPEDIIRRF